MATDNSFVVGSQWRMDKSTIPAQVNQIVVFKNHIQGKLALETWRLSNMFKVNRSSKDVISYQCSSDVNQVSYSEKKCSFFVKIKIGEV
jgi:hypothetical protein